MKILLDSVRLVNELGIPFWEKTNVNKFVDLNKYLKLFLQSWGKTNRIIKIDPILKNNNSFLYKSSLVFLQYNNHLIAFDCSFGYSNISYIR